LNTAENTNIRPFPPRRILNTQLGMRPPISSRTAVAPEIMPA
jgi:hypothetical protein